MPKKILQDVVPKKSIRSITRTDLSGQPAAPARETLRPEPRMEPRHEIRSEVPEPAPRPEARPEVRRAPIRPMPMTPPPQPQQNREYIRRQEEFGSEPPVVRTEKRSSSRRVIYFVGIVLILLAVAAGLMSVFSYASVKITPKRQIVQVDTIMTAKKDPKLLSELPYEVLSLSNTATQDVVATPGDIVQVKAKGRAVLYNSFSAEAQKLVAGTRLQNTKGLIYRIDTNVTIPGYKKVGTKITPGSLEVGITADQYGDIYNSKLTDLTGDFTIVAFEDTPKAKTIYGRLKSDITGGFVGRKLTVAPEVASSTEQMLRKEIEAKLMQEYTSRIPQGFIAYPGTHVISYDKPEVTTNEGGKGQMTQTGTIYGSILSIDSLVNKLLSKESERFPKEYYSPQGLDSLEFTLINKKEFSAAKDTNMTFQLKGTMYMVGLVPAEDLKKTLTGLTLDESKSIFSNYKGVGNANVSVTPFWIDHFPKKADRISIDTIDFK
ncbi:MAG: hypothetical protein V4526_00120 [Patescibacteria group bacterium]